MMMSMTIPEIEKGILDKYTYIIGCIFRNSDNELKFDFCPGLFNEEEKAEAQAEVHLNAVRSNPMLAAYVIKCVPTVRLSKILKKEKIEIELESPASGRKITI